MKIFLTSLILLLNTLCIFGQEMTQWQDVRAAAEGKETPRTTFVSYPNRDSALMNDYSKSRNYISLNGKWKFIYTEDHKKLPVASVINPKINFDNWFDIMVPGSWESQEYGNTTFCDGEYEFNTTAPELPGSVPVGVYKRNIEVPLTWLDKDIYLNVHDASSALYIFVNGKKVAYNDDSKSPGEYLLNEYVHEGVNNITMILYKWSCGSFLECQKGWKRAGIEGDVYIHLQPKNHIYDLDIRATMDSTYTHGHLKMDVIYSNSYNGEEEIELYYEILDQKGEIIKYYTANTLLSPNARDTLHFDAVIAHAKMWSSEKPNLYTIVFRTKKGKRFIEYIPIKIGFRNIAIEDNKLLVNGAPVTIKGVNYYGDSNTRDIDKLRGEIKLMRQSNINAIRCAHPMPDIFYNLCDEYGIYVCDQANIASQGSGTALDQTLGNKPQWLAKHLERTENIYYRNRNHPSLIFWSLGDKAGNGINMYESYLHLRALDSLRPIAYQGADLEWNTDIFFAKELSAEEIGSWSDTKVDRPYIIPSYCIGNNNMSGLSQLWSKIDSHDGLQGGFICCWSDFGVDENCCNGLVTTKGEPTISLSNIKQAYQNIDFTHISGGLFSIKNKFISSNLSEYNIGYKILVNGRTVRNVPLKLSLAPGQSKEIKISIPSHQAGKCFISFYATAKHSSKGIPSGFTVASKRIQL